MALNSHSLFNPSKKLKISFDAEIKPLMPSCEEIMVLNLDKILLNLSKIAIDAIELVKLNPSEGFEVLDLLDEIYNLVELKIAAFEEKERIIRVEWSEKAFEESEIIRMNKLLVNYQQF